MKKLNREIHTHRSYTRMLSTHDYCHFKILDAATGAVELEFEGAEKAERSLPEDRVFMSAAGRLVLLERAPKRNLVGILRLTGKTLYGMTGHGVPLYLCEPLNVGYPPFRVSCREGRTEDLLIVFQFDTWELGHEMPRGAMVEVLGSVENEAAQQKALEILACPWTAPMPEQKFPPLPTQPHCEIEQQFDEFGYAISTADELGDARWLTTGTFNIDPPGCRDIDDVMTLVPTANPDVWEFWITIADLTETVIEGSPMYKTARKIGATTYTPEGKAVRPMLHKTLSEERCSLLPGQVRQGVAYGFEFHMKQRLWRDIANTTHRFVRVYVVNQESYTYESILKSKTVPLTVLRAVCAYLSRTPETDDPHKWVEDAMVFYNREVARGLQSAGYGLLRIHDAPLAEKLNRLKELGRPELDYLAYASAEYCSASTTTDTHHFGLNTDVYCHATSPLRRFSDLYNQQILCCALRNGLKHNTSLLPSLQEQRLAFELNRRMRDIARAERDMAFRKALGAAESGDVEALVLWEEAPKTAFWIPAWKTMIKKRLDAAVTPGETVRLAYYADKRKNRWKERIIIQILTPTAVSHNENPHPEERVGFRSLESRE